MRSLRPLILQPDAAPYGANRALLRAIIAMPPGSVRPVVAFPYAGDAIAEYEQAGCETVVTPLAVLRRSSAGPRGMARLSVEWRRTARQLSEIARKHECDLVHTNSMTIISGGPAARSAGIPHVWQLREAPRERGLKAWLLGRLLRSADRVLAVSAAAAALAPACAVRVIHDGYDLPADVVTPSTRIGREGELLVGMIGRISPSKAPHVAVEAFGLLAERGVDAARLVLAGTVYPGYEPYAQGQVLDRATEVGVADRLDVLGWLDDPHPLLAQLDVLVIATSAGEGFPGAVLEALAHGVPVVSCATGGVDELVLHERTGLVCEPGSVSQIADALEHLLADPALRTRLGAAGRDHAAQFTVRRSADELLAEWEHTVR